MFNILSEANRFKLGEEISAPYNAPALTMDGFTPEQIPVLSGLARGFGVFDHWFCEVPPQTFKTRSASARPCPPTAKPS